MVVCFVVIRLFTHIQSHTQPTDVQSDTVTGTFGNNTLLETMETIKSDSVVEKYLPFPVFSPLGFHRVTEHNFPIGVYSCSTETEPVFF